MTEISDHWDEWSQDVDISVSWEVQISQIYVYPASFQTLQFWRSKSEVRIRDVLVCQDVMLVDKDGYQLRLVTQPGIGVLSRLEGSFVRVTGVMKVSQCGHQLLVITSWSPTPAFPLKFKSIVSLPGYADLDKPLCNPSSDLLCPWTCLYYDWSDCSVIKRKYSLTSLNLNYNFNINNLRQLNQQWTVISRVWPLVVRVLAKCKERLILQQNNVRKPWMCLTNLLVADSSSHTIITVWDTAVGSFSKSVKEGDILVLQRYSPARLKPSHRKIIHNLAPKARLSSLLPTEIELKINQSDVDHVTIVHNGAVCDTVPPLLCSFTTSHQLTRNMVAPGRLVDMVGMVVWQGRWEREAVSWQQCQAWVRVWLQVVDHSSDQVISVKVYTDLETWDQCEAALPGEVVILTNLVCVFQEKMFSHLESSNQTSVYSGSSATDSRFRDDETVQQFRESLESEQPRYQQLVRSSAGLGGQYCVGQEFSQSVSVLDCATSEIVNFDQLCEALSKIAVYGSKRLLVLAEVIKVEKFKVSESGEISLVENLLDKPVELEYLNQEIGEKKPCIESLRIGILTFKDKNALKVAATKYCYLNLAVQDSSSGSVSLIETETSIVTLVVKGSLVHALMDVENVEELLVNDGDHVMLDCFRSHNHEDRVDEGVEIVLRHVVKLKTGSESQDTTGSPNNSLLSTTFDIVNAITESNCDNNETKNDMESNDDSSAVSTGRTKLPVPQPEKVNLNLWSYLKQCIGKELSKITMPVHWNEPLSLLQRISEYMNYSHLLRAAPALDDPLLRLQHVATFAVSALASNYLRMGKPFNPLLGETYQLEQDGFRIVCEQVCHHPPVSAFHAESTTDTKFVFRGSMYPKTKFWGKSIEFQPRGVLTVELDNEEVYTWSNVSCVVHNIVMGSLWMEQTGTMEIVSHKHGLRAVLTFKPGGWFSGDSDLHCVEGFIVDKDKKKLAFLYGRWTEFLCSAPPESLAKLLGCNLAKVDVSASNLGKHPPLLPGAVPDSKIIWEAAARPEHSSLYYNFSSFTMKLNEAGNGGELAPTDCRLRPDIRALENGDLDLAAKEKESLENKQREFRKPFKGKKESEWWTPRWFAPSKHSATGDEDWTFSGGFWDGDFSKSPQIF